MKNLIKGTLSTALILSTLCVTTFAVSPILGTSVTSTSISSGNSSYYSNTVSSTQGGTATLSNLSAKAGEKVNVFFSCHDGYYMKSIHLTTVNGDALLETDGVNYWFTQTPGSAVVNVTFEQGVGVTEVGGGVTSPFIDVPSDSWYFPYVKAAAENGWMAVPSQTTFEPLSQATRGMIAAALYSMVGSPPISLANTFLDVPVGSWYENGIIWCEENGVATGMGNNTFMPNESVTREQLTVMLRGFGAATQESVEIPTSYSTFADGSSISEWAHDSVYWAQASGLMSGRDGNVFDPKGTATRAELAVILLAIFDQFII